MKERWWSEGWGELQEKTDAHTEACHHLTTALFPTAWPLIISPFFPYNVPFLLLSCFALLWMMCIIGFFLLFFGLLSWHTDHAFMAALLFLLLHFGIEKWQKWITEKVVVKPQHLNWLKLHLTDQWERRAQPCRPCFLSSFLTIKAAYMGLFDATELQKGQKDNFRMHSNISCCYNSWGVWIDLLSHCRNGVHTRWQSRFLCFNDVCVLKGWHCRTIQLSHINQWFQSNQSLIKAHNNSVTSSILP